MATTTNLCRATHDRSLAITEPYGVAITTIYEQRWGSFARAREEAYQLFGTPLVVTIYRQWAQEMQNRFPSLLEDS
jgi:hypothetical protein